LCLYSPGTQPCSSAFTPDTNSLTLTLLLPSRSKDAQVLTAARSSAMLTPTTNSLTVTRPFASQSPTQGIGPDVGVIVGVFRWVVGVGDGVGVSTAAATWMLSVVAAARSPTDAFIRSTLLPAANIVTVVGALGAVQVNSHAATSPVLCFGEL